MDESAREQFYRSMISDILRIFSNDRRLDTRDIPTLIGRIDRPQGILVTSDTFIVSLSCVLS